MSAIFETEFRDLSDADGNVTKASTAKLVLLAMADHANDEGEGAYPGLTLMEKKTALSRQGVINTYRALKHNGIITLQEDKSKLGTNNYTINKNAFQRATYGSQPSLLVNPVDQGSKPTLLGVVNPVDLNHTLTTSLTNDDVKARTQELTDLYWQNIGSPTPLMADILRNAAIDYPEASWYRPAFETAVRSGARHWNYVDAVLKGWKQNGYGWKPEKRQSRPTSSATGRGSVMDSLRQYQEQHANE